MDTYHIMQERFKHYSELLDERSLRLVAATEAVVLGYGGISQVSKTSGISRPVITHGIKEIRGQISSIPPSRVRRTGGGRKPVEIKDRKIKAELKRLVEPTTRGDPESPLLWTTKSVRHLADELKARSHGVCPAVVARLLHGMEYSLQGNRKTKEGSSHPDRDAQFEYINDKVKSWLAYGQPVISVDTKKKELVGNFKNNGREWRPKGKPEDVRMYDFIIRELGRASPYGVFDIGSNAGWVNVGMDHDTAAFAVESIRRWWNVMGRHTYPQAKQLLITADGGGSNGYRVRQWKWEIQKMADEIGLNVSVCHFPPGTSKWNKIEHRLFSFISMNWRGKPLTSYEVIVSLIGSTKTTTGLRVKCRLDKNRYPLGIKITNKQMITLALIGDTFHPEWNYMIQSRKLH